MLNISLLHVKRTIQENPRETRNVPAIMENPTVAKMTDAQNAVQTHGAGAQQANDETLDVILDATSAANQSQVAQN